MFSTIKLYIIGIGTALIGVLYAIIKLKNAKIEKIEEENATHEIKAVISDKMEEAQRDSAIKESEAQSNIKDSNWRKNI